MSHFAFVESNTTGTGRLAVERLLAAGERVTFLTRTPAKYPFLAPHDGLAVVETDTNDADALSRAFGHACEHAPIDAVLTFSEFYVEAVAVLAQARGLRGLSPVAARTCRDKHALREALHAAGLPTPPFALIRSEEEARAASRTAAYPCVLKPPSDSSSHGVRLVDGPDELLAHFRRLHAVRENVRGQRVPGHVLLEGLLDGPEFSVETVTVPGEGTVVVGVTDKHLSAPPVFVETGHDFPSGAPEPRRRALEDAVRAALAAVGFDCGPAHTEVRFTAAGPVVVEVNPRLAGGLIPELVAHATGLDLLGAWFDLLRGRPVDLRPRCRAFASIRFLTAPRPGRLREVEGLAAAWADPVVRDVFTSARVGEEVRPAEDAYGRLGHVIAAGPARAQVIRAVEASARAVRFALEPEPALAVAAPP